MGAAAQFTVASLGAVALGSLTALAWVSANGEDVAAFDETACTPQCACARRVEIFSELSPTYDGTVGQDELVMGLPVLRWWLLQRIAAFNHVFSYLKREKMRGAVVYRRRARLVPLKNTHLTPQAVSARRGAGGRGGHGLEPLAVPFGGAGRDGDRRLGGDARARGRQARQAR